MGENCNIYDDPSGIGFFLRESCTCAWNGHSKFWGKYSMQKWLYYMKHQSMHHCILSFCMAGNLILD